jgi:hypothetical protein
MLLQVKPNIQTRVAIIVIHRYALALEIPKTIDIVPHDKIIFAPGVIALRNMYVGIIIERLPGIKVMVITRNDIELTGFQPLGGPLALPFREPKSISKPCFSRKPHSSINFHSGTWLGAR